jgi:hypothetical protein
MCEVLMSWQATAPMTGAANRSHSRRWVSACLRDHRSLTGRRSTAFVATEGSLWCAAIVYQAARRRWWAASGSLAFGAGLSLGTATAGNHSRIEHDVVFAVELATIAYYMIASAADRKASKRRGAKLSNLLSDDGP